MTTNKVTRGHQALWLSEVSHTFAGPVAVISLRCIAIGQTELNIGLQENLCDQLVSWSGWFAKRSSEIWPVMRHHWHHKRYQFLSITSKWMQARERDIYWASMAADADQRDVCSPMYGHQWTTKREVFCMQPIRKLRASNIFNNYKYLRLCTAGSVFVW
jgi:hypothetical protein